MSPFLHPNIFVLKNAARKNFTKQTRPAQAILLYKFVKGEATPISNDTITAQRECGGKAPRIPDLSTK
jgi:hypothetical protein